MSKNTVFCRCRTCNAEFSIAARHVRRGNGRGRYCSRICADAGKKRDSLELTKIMARLWKRVERRSSNECWPWRGATHNGYGVFGWGGRGSKNSAAIKGCVHRFVLAVATGMIETDLRISTELYALHSCDNRLCCNPAHLRWGTHLENIRDMNDRGRQAKGEGHGTFLKPESIVRGERQPLAKLTERSVSDARLRFARGEVTIAALAREHAVCISTMRDAVHRRAWKHVV